MSESEIAQLRGNFCLAAGRDAVVDMQPYLKTAANDPCRESILAMAFSLALAHRQENSVRCLAPVLATEGLGSEYQVSLAQQQGAGRFLTDVIRKMKTEAA